MDYGFVKIACAIPEVKVGDCKYNTANILKLIEQADNKNVQIVVFPELCITGYTCGDLFFQETLLSSTQKNLQKILNKTKNSDMVCILGLPIRNDNQLFNCAVVIHQGRILGAIPKTHIPNHNEFYELRWFSSSYNKVNDTAVICSQEVPFDTNILFKSNNLCFGVEICEDLWSPIPPSTFHCLKGANLIFNTSASNELIAKIDYRRRLVTQQSARGICGYAYVSAGTGESTTDLVFSGDAIISENGTILSESERFKSENQLIVDEIDIESLENDRNRINSYSSILQDNYIKHKKYLYVNFNLRKIDITTLKRNINSYPFVPSDTDRRSNRCEDIFSMQVTGLAKRLKHIGSKTAVLGISGGLDSTLALLVTVKTFDKLKYDRKNIIAITMPGFGTSDRTYNNALKLMSSLGVSIKEINISKACLQHFEDIGQDPYVHDVTYENTQARERTQILMDIANQNRGIVVGTGDLSELALGWATYNGDHMSMYSVNSGIPKTLVRYLVRWVAENVVKKESKETLYDVLDTPVSPELLPADKKGEINQKTEDIVGPYAVHDFFLYNMVRHGYSPRKILFLASLAFKDIYDAETIKQWLKIFYKRFFSQQFKRSCMPDGPKVGTINLSPRGDWRMPSDASSSIWLDEIKNL